MLAGCSSLVADLPLVGLPKDAPRRSEQQADYPQIGPKPERDGRPLNAQDRAAAEAELAATRSKQASEAQKQPAPR